MYNIFKKVVSTLMIICLGINAFLIPAVSTAPAFAEEESAGEDCVPTAILGEGGKACDNGSGDSIIHIIVLVVRILTVGVGILAVLGVTIVGVQYLTAGGNEEQTRKAKRRLFEIVIGIAAYILLYALLEWLLPGFDSSVLNQ